MVSAEQLSPLLLLYIKVLKIFFFFPLNVAASNISEIMSFMGSEPKMCQTAVFTT